MKRKWVWGLMILSIVTFSVPAMAGHGKQDGHGYGLDDKFFYKAMSMIAYQEEIGLSEAQVQQIIDLKYQVKKDLATYGAQVDVIKYDIHAKLYGHQIDTEAIGALIDQKYEVKKKKAKSLVNAFAALKAVLTPDQYAAMKSIWLSKKQ